MERLQISRHKVASVSLMGRGRGWRASLEREEEKKNCSRELADVGGCRGRGGERKGAKEEWREGRKSGGQSEANQIMQDRSPWGVGPRPLCYIGSKVSRRGSRLLGRALLIPSATTTGRLSASNLAGHVTNTGASGRGVITADNIRAAANRVAVVFSLRKGRRAACFGGGEKGGKEMSCFFSRWGVFSVGGDRGAIVSRGQVRRVG